MKKIKTLLLACSGLFALSQTATAQVTTDLQLTVLTPANGEIIPYGDTAKLIVSIKNLGPGLINGDTVALTISGFAFATIVHDTIAVGDSVNIHMLSGWNTEADDSPFDGCVNLDYTLFPGITDGNSANDTSCVSFVLQGGSTGIKEHYNDIAWKAYPNPVSNLLNIELPDGVSGTAYSVTDYTGKVLIKEPATINSGARIDLGSLPTGLYYLSIDTNKGTVARKISIVH